MYQPIAGPLHVTDPGERHGLGVRTDLTRRWNDAVGRPPAQEVADRPGPVSRPRFPGERRAPTPREVPVEEVRAPGVTLGGSVDLSAQLDSDRSRGAVPRRKQGAAIYPARHAEHDLVGRGRGSRNEAWSLVAERSRDREAHPPLDTGGNLVRGQKNRRACWTESGLRVFGVRRHERKPDGAARATRQIDGTDTRIPHDDLELARYRSRRAAKHEQIPGGPDGHRGVADSGYATSLLVVTDVAIEGFRGGRRTAREQRRREHQDACSSSDTGRQHSSQRSCIRSHLWVLHSDGRGRCPLPWRAAARSMALGHRGPPSLEVWAPDRRHEGVADSRPTPTSRWRVRRARPRRPRMRRGRAPGAAGAGGPRTGCRARRRGGG